MAGKKPAEDLHYPFDTAPSSGETLEVAPGVHWLRMPLPFALAHINLWLLEDGGEWVIVDTGLHTEESTAIWEQLLADRMQARRVNRVIATHLHPDHAGNAGWLCERLNSELLMTLAEYMLCRVLIADTGRPAPAEGINFYRAAGFANTATEKYRKMFGMFGKMMSPMPESYRRLRDGDTITIGDRVWQVIVGRGHSPEHACLYDSDARVLLSGDQILPTISSNVSVYPTEPAANPLADWLQSIATLRERLPEDVLVLPAHGKPFHGAHQRLDSLRDEHLDGLEKLQALCTREKRVVDVFPALFRREIQPRELIMASGEAIAHLNWLIAAGRMTSRLDPAGIRWYQSQD